MLLKSLKLAKSSYFYQLSVLSKNKYARIKERINEIFNCSYQSYGYRRIKNEGTVISEKVIRRLIREESLFARGVKKRRYSPYLGEISPAVPNIINRDWNNTTINEFTKQLNAYIILYNSKRIKKSLGYKSPIDYRKSLGLKY